MVGTHHVAVICSDYSRSKRFCAEVPELEVTGGVLPLELYEQ